MQIASFTLAVLSLIQFNTAPIDTPVSEKSLNVVSSFLNYPEKAGSSFTFPDRSVEAYQAKALDEQREQALEAAKQAEAIKVAQAQKNAPQAPKVAQSTPVDSNSAKMFIYMKESGNNPNARNAGGCLGLGQACPGSKLLAVCPNLDYACQDAFFTNYALSRYGSWEGALAFWQGHHWW